MIADLKPYPAMKDSGVPWLGEVPEHWDVRRLGALLSERGETNAEGRITDVLSVLKDRGVIPYAEKGNIGNKKSEDITRYKIVRPNDIVVNCMNVIIGSVGLSKFTGCLSPVYYVLTRRSETDRSRYLDAYFQTRPFQRSLVRIGNGILAHRMRVPMELLKCEPFPRPPTQEQAAIVRYLDHADRRIQRYIRAKQKLITLLEEQKQAIIHQVVTGKVDIRTGQPYPAYKPSGVEWLGRVPEHWERRAVWQLFHIGRGKVTSHEYIANHSGSFPLYSSQTANDGVMGYIDTFMFDGDFLTWTTDGANAGTVFRRSGKFNCTNVCGTLFPKAQLDLDFMRMAIASETKRQVRLDINPKLMNNMMARIRVSVPPYDEQVRITKYVQGIAKPSDSVIERVKIQVGFLREYRTRLIADVVTGKLDVREAVARLPDEAEEPEPLDETDALTDGEEEPTDDRDDAPEEAAV